jgi:uncharacterized LabA/DUF88 family protein
MAEANSTRGNLRLAVLIDADNAPRDCIRGLLEELAKYGVPTVKRIYGDWTSPNLKGWKESLLQNAFTPVQQYSYTTGKNSTDSAMIIDAMDILYGGRIDGFVLVSSDSDFTRLATRLRETGMYVIGIGERKTPNPFIVSCDKFIYTEVIRNRDGGSDGESRPAAEVKGSAEKKKDADPKKPVAAPKKPAENHGQKQNVPGDIIELIAASLSDLADEDGFVPLSDLTNLINKKRPDFDPRNFGFSKLSNMMKYLPRFEVDVRETGDPHAKPMYIRDVEV